MTSAIKPLEVRFFASPSVNKASNRAAVIALRFAILLLCGPFILFMGLVNPASVRPEGTVVLFVFFLLLPFLTIPCVIYGHKARRFIRSQQGRVRGSVTSFFALLTGYTFIVLVVTGYATVISLEINGEVYFARAQADDALSVAMPLKNAVSKYRQHEGAWPTSNAVVGHGPLDKYRSPSTVAAVSVGDHGVITIVMESVGVKAVLAGREIRLVPTDESGTISWTCSNNLADDDQNALPTPCRRKE